MWKVDLDSFPSHKCTQHTQRQPLPVTVDVVLLAVMRYKLNMQTQKWQQHSQPLNKAKCEIMETLMVNLYLLLRNWQGEGSGD